MQKRDTKPVKRVVLPDNELLDRELVKFTSKGWQIVNRTSSAVQLRRPKTWSPLLLLPGLFGFLLGFGVIFLILAAVEYFTKDEASVYFTVENVRRGDVPPPTVISIDQWVLFGLGIFLTVLFFGCAFMMYA